MMKNPLQWSCLIGWILFLMTVQAYATVTISLDRYQINEGETVRLTIVAAGQISTMPDTKPLEQDFEVKGVASGSRVNIVNGRMSASTTWNIAMTPKRSGTLTVPALNIDGEYTPVLTLQVNEASSHLSAGATTPVFIETMVDKNDPYVQGMVLYTVRIFFTVNLANASLSDPQADNAVIRGIGEDRHYNEVRDGITYQVVERQYAIFPQTSGNLVLNAPILDAQVPESSSQRDLFFDRMMMGTRPMRLRGDPYILSVRPRPDENIGTAWLPAESVELSETWQPEPGQLNVNEPLTRVITIKASAMAGEQLPDLEFPDIDGFKIYPDPAQAETHNLANNVIGEKTRRVAYIPVQPGSYTLPAITLHWWDTKTDQQRVATLPERVIEVGPAQNTQHPPLQQPDATAPLVGTANRAIDGNVLSSIPDAETLSRASDKVWFWLSLAFAALWLVTLRLWWRNRRPLVRQPENITQYINPESTKKARKQFLSACRKNNPKLARQTLLQWAAIHWSQSPPTGLDELALRLDNEQASAALIALDSALYQDKNAKWNGKKLAQAINKLPEYQCASDDKLALPSLYQ